MAPAGPPADWLFEQAACGLVLTDADGVIVRANAVFCNWLGYTAQELAGARRLQDLFTIGARVFHQTHLAPLLQMQGSIAEVAIDLVHRDGHALPVLLNMVRQSHGGEVLHQAAVVIVADRKKYERELLKTRAQLRELNESLSQADKSKDEFLATLGHELRNPLNPIKIAVHLLRQGSAAAEPDTRKLVDIIDRQAQQLEHLTNGLMDGAAVRTGKIALKPGLLVLQDVVRAAVEQVAPRVQERSHRLEVLLPEAPVKLIGDEARLIQMLANLLANAAKYTPPGGILTLGAQADPQWVALDVQDTGIGLDPADLTRIFDMFAQVPDAANLYRGGLGIGLALVQKIVELHGGSIEAFSEGKGRGTRFHVRLPRGV